MSVELPEAGILADQMNRELRGKQVETYELKNCEKLQKIGFINKDSSVFQQLVNRKVASVQSRGNVILIKFDSGINLILGPEYGGRILYFTNEENVPAKFNLRLDFSDHTVLTVTLTGMGAIQVFKDGELKQSYVYKRDFSDKASPADERQFTFDRFSKQLSEKSVNIKLVLVGKEALIVGLSNSAFQDVLFRAKIHPKRKASDLSNGEAHALYDAVKELIAERNQFGGKLQFSDLYGRQGRYTALMGPDMKGKTCSACGSSVEALSLGGGRVFFCPNCQR
jgi:formamidopyrimidine-DNA glycosylase